MLPFDSYVCAHFFIFPYFILFLCMSKLVPMLAYTISRFISFYLRIDIGKICMGSISNRREEMAVVVECRSRETGGGGTKEEERRKKV